MNFPIFFLLTLLLCQGPQSRAELREPLDTSIVPSNQLPEDLRGVSVEQKLGAAIPLDLSFQDEFGHPVRLSEIIRDKPVILSFAYFKCPGLCTLVLTGLVNALRELKPELGRDFRALTLSISPKETHALALSKKRSYLARYGKLPIADDSPAWRFLTGQEETIRKFADATGFHYVFDPRSGDYSHASVIMILTPEGKLSQYLFGIRYAPLELERALASASHSGIGSPLAQLLLYCFHYDGSKGRWTPRILNLMRVLAALTVVALAILLAGRRRKELLP